MKIKNIGEFDIEEVVQCYIKDLESKYAVVNHSLAGFKRVEVKKGESKIVTMKVKRASFEEVNDDGERILDSKNFKLFVGVSQPDSRSVQLTGIEPLEVNIKII